MGLFKSKPAPLPDAPPPPAAPAPFVEQPALGHPHTLAFWDMLRRHDFDAAIGHFNSIQTWGLREYETALSPAMLDDIAPIPAWADAFVAAHPNESLAWLLRGVSGVAAAWVTRGSGPAESVTEASMASFRALLSAAEHDLIRAHQLDETSPLPWVHLVTTGRGLHIPKDELLLRADEGASRAQDLYLLHTSTLQGLCAKWSGSHDEMFTFAREIASEAGVGSALHALVVMSHLERAVADPSAAYFSDQTVREEIWLASQYSVFEPSFVDDEWHPEAARARNTVACGLQRAGFTREAQLQAHYIGSRLASEPWSYFGRPDALVTQALAG